MKPWIVIGAGTIADVVATYLERLAGGEALAGFAVDAEFLEADTHLGKPVVEIDCISDRFPPDAFDAFVALGYHDLNQTRLARMTKLRDMGYDLPHLVDERAFVAPNATIGPNALVLDGASLEPYAQIGQGTFVWSNVVVGHHTSLGAAVWVTAGAMLGGNTVVGDRSFIGLGALVGNGVQLGQECLVGAGALVTKSAPDGAVFAMADTPRHRLGARHFQKIARLE